MGSGNAASKAGLVYVGAAIYMGPDDPSIGLTHAKTYDISARKLKSGRVRVEVDEALVKRLTFEDENEFKLIFRKQATYEKRRRK